MDFHCEDGDFTVRSSLDGTAFQARRSALETSQFFHDLFFCCKEPPAQENVIELHEPSTSVVVLLRLLHDPPQPPVEVPKDKSAVASNTRTLQKMPKVYQEGTVIPFPLLQLMLQLVDKYALPQPTMECLGQHLRVYAPSNPLQVYAVATSYGFDKAASKASEYLMPIASYGVDEIKILPTVEAYHKIARLQDFRVKAMKDLVLTEEIFPHGYGVCTSHREMAETIWDRTRKAVAARIQIGIDIAGEFESVPDLLKNCKHCHKASIAAVEMLTYKCHRVPRGLSQVVLPSE
ncbi:hypothetical protein BDN72DRAFT_807019 [Pluteus cervinus]|uniref:Uncharacterized protein n=1 Tax=Pluteus cervinus TaxID=181527 RepID=A0ACD3BGR8_9AGAR|nr:hypothetical protein BDN72DRAFT_807019 [Pluteus cervinus]